MHDTLPPSAPLCGFVPDDEASMRFATGSDHFRLLRYARPWSGARRSESVVLQRTPPIVQRWQDCVANAVADAFLYEMVLVGLVKDPHELFVHPVRYNAWLPSRRQIYWNARALVGAERIDAGTQPGAMVRAINAMGFCAEQWCPYEGPPEENPYALNDAAGRMAIDQAGRIELLQCMNFEDVIDALAMRHRVMIGAPVFASMEHVGDGEFYVPDGPLLGRHMWQLVGYEEGGGVVRMKNSWAGWGDANQEAFAQRSIIERDMVAAFAFARVSPYSEAV